MSKSKSKLMTDEEVEREIARLNASADVRLAKMEMRIKNKRRQYMYQLRNLERKGRELASQGLTVDNIEEALSEEE